MSSIHESIIQEDKIKKFKNPNQKRQGRIAFIVIIAVLLLAGGGYYLLTPKENVYVLQDYDTAVVEQGDLDQIIQASGTVAIPVTLTVLSPEAGYTAALIVEEGQTVIKGQVLARLDISDLEDELEDLQAELEVKVQDLESSIEQDRYTILKLEQSLEYNEADIASGQEELARIEQLVAINSSRQSEADAVEDQIETLLREREVLELQLEEQQKLSTLSQDSQNASIKLSLTEIKRLELRIAEASITSPMDGEVLEIADDLAVPGSLISENEALFSIADRSSALVELEISETYSGYLKQGQPVDLTIGSGELTGTIGSVGKVAVASSDGIGSTVTVKVIPDGSPETLVPGSTVVGELQIGTQENVLSLPRGSYLTTGSQKYLYVVEGDTAVKREVGFGTVQGNDIVLLRGVQAGEEVIISGYQNYIEYESVKLEKEN